MIAIFNSIYSLLSVHKKMIPHEWDTYPQMTISL